MSDQTKSEPGSPSASEPATTQNEVHVELAGKDVLTTLRKATQLAGGNSQYAVEIALKLSRLLEGTEAKVVQLERQISALQEEVQLYRVKSERAEEWLNRISGEIQEQVSKTIN